jgi:hypothetical protein
MFRFLRNENAYFRFLCHEIVDFVSYATKTLNFRFVENEITQNEHEQDSYNISLNKNIKLEKRGDF